MPYSDRFYAILDGDHFSAIADVQVRDAIKIITTTPAARLALTTIMDVLDAEDRKQEQAA